MRREDIVGRGPAQLFVVRLPEERAARRERRLDEAPRHAVVADDQEADFTARAVDRARDIGSGEIDKWYGARHAVAANLAPTT